MNKTKLKNYAPQARKDFIAAVSARANQLGLSCNGSTLVVAPATRQGDVTLIEGRDWPAKVYGQRERLIKRMQRDGFEQTVESVAYTWFNRFAALRYMELHDYLEHGYRVLSSATCEVGGVGTPDILLHAVDLVQNQNLPGLNADEIGRLKLVGNQDGELYRKLLIAQCNELSNAMPFLFERIDDETELLLPDNLLRTDSVIAKLVAEIPEEDWQEVEVIGWLYQFYISEKKDLVIGKVVNSEDIPAATQLFTPNWIVQYMVQNSVGRTWMMANPNSTLKSQWQYYIDPAEQTPEANSQLDALIKTRMDEDGGSLNPETITVLDPACGSGHILVEAYELLKGIYLERGYRLRDIPRLILEKNLFGLDIDDRAAQMACFALLMKGRADDRRFLSEPAMLNILSLKESKGLNNDELETHLTHFGIQNGVVKRLLNTFENAKTFGSLIRIPSDLGKDLPQIFFALKRAIQTGDLYETAAAQEVFPFVLQAKILDLQFDVVIANPPYMSGSYLTPLLKKYLKQEYNGFEKDLFSTFMVRNLMLTRESGQLGFMSPFVWMFISSYEELRNHFIENNTMTSLVQLEYSGFDGATVPICTFTVGKKFISDYSGSYIRLSDFRGSEQQAPKTIEAIGNRNCGWLYSAKQNDFKKIQGAPIAYWASKKALSCFDSSAVADYFVAKKGMAIGDNARFLRLWCEVDFDNIGLNISQPQDTQTKKWYPCLHGGAYRKWSSNKQFVVNWKCDGKEPKEANTQRTGAHWSRDIHSTEYFFRHGVNWSAITSGGFSARYHSCGFAFTSATMAAFQDSKPLEPLLAMVNSEVGKYFLKLLSPTLNYGIAEFKKLPFKECVSEPELIESTKRILFLSTQDWNAYERSWEFHSSPLVSATLHGIKTIESSYLACISQNMKVVSEVKMLEELNNKLLIDAYGLGGELSADVPVEQITLTSNPAYRYGVGLSESELSSRLRQDAASDLVSYSIGCMMGRYSLDNAGLVYAKSGNANFDSNLYKRFPVDADGIVPITEYFWFDDDAANRIYEFLTVVWGSEKRNENLAWLAEGLGKKASETSEETIRRYLADKFYKDHLQSYKKRPIYWHFSSGKQGAFQALVYLHRYHEGTLARMRAEYVVPLTGKIQSRIEMLDKDALSTSSTTARNKINKDVERLKKQYVELLAYDEKLRHYADMRINLDLDDGVKVNYGKFGDLLAEVKAITGGAADD